MRVRRNEKNAKRSGKVVERIAREGNKKKRGSRAATHEKMEKREESHKAKI